MKTVLIVDDETSLLRHLVAYLGRFKDELEILTAATGEDAVDILSERQDIDILLSDVRLPGIDGIEVIRRGLGFNPDLKVIVMTAYGSPQVRQTASDLGAIRFLEKPLDLKHLRDLLVKTAADEGGWSGSVGGLDIFDLTQLFILGRKTRAIRVRYADQTGSLVFDQGRLVHASSVTSRGDEAFYEMSVWGGGQFEEIPESDAKDLKPNITSPTDHILMEAARRKDHAELEAGEDDHLELDFGNDGDDGAAAVVPIEPKPQSGKEKETMALKDHLDGFASIEGFKGAAVFTAQGEMLEGVTSGKLDVKTVGMFANNALLNAQKATDQMGVGRGNLVQIRAPQATLLMRCLNEATDFAANKEGKAHFHVVVVMDPEGNTGMARMILDSAVTKMADELR